MITLSKKNYFNLLYSIELNHLDWHLCLLRKKLGVYNRRCHRHLLT